MENFLKETKGLKKIKTGELAGLVYDYQDAIIGFYIKKSFSVKFKKQTDALFERMRHEKFAKAIGKILKRAKKDEGIVLDPGFAVVINGFIEYNQKAEVKADDATIEAYYEIIDKLLRKQAKKLAKDLDLDESVIKEVLVIAPNKDYISSEKYVGLYSQKMLRKLYVLAGQEGTELGLATTKQVKKLFTKIFGKNLLDVIAVHILLEKKEYIAKYSEPQIAVWNLFTRFALETIEAQEKDHIKELIKYFTSRRRSDENRQNDAARRISLIGLPEEEYPRICKIVNKIKDEKIKKYL